MYWIEPHTDSKILKLGFGSMALYREKKPEKEIKSTKDVAIGYGQFSKHLKSFIGYIKEPEWKEGDVVKRNYPDSTSGYMVGNLIAIKGEMLICFNSPYDEGILKKDATHFHPGQQVESFKYVKRVRLETFKWQEVEQPEHQIESITRKNTWETNPKYTQFQEELKSGVILLEVITKE